MCLMTVKYVFDEFVPLLLALLFTLYTSTMKTQETKNDTRPNAKDKKWQIHEVKSKQ